MLLLFFYGILNLLFVVFKDIFVLLKLLLISGSFSCVLRVVGVFRWFCGA